MKKLGILGGISAASTIDYYRKITELYYDKFHNYYYPEITIESLDFQYFTDLEDTNNMPEYKDYIIQGIRNLESAKCDVIIMSANSPHSVYDDVMPYAKVPMISIVEAVGRKAQDMGLKKILLTGIKYTMQSTFYRDGLKKYGIEVISPSESDQDLINQIIFGELVINIITKESQQLYLDIVDKYIASDQIEGVIMGCTEIPSLAANLDAPVPFLNSLQLHCEKTLDFLIED